jgi:F-type H+-transporting ATPase subunit a
MWFGYSYFLPFIGGDLNYLFMFNFFSPLEQFEIVPFINLKFYSSLLGFFDFSITNQTFVIFLVIILSIFFYSSLLSPKTYTLYIIPTRFQVFIELLYKIILSIVISNVGKEGQIYFPLIFAIFFYILSFNLIGLIPYSFTITSHIIVTLSLSLFFFIGINLISIKKHGLKFFALFLPTGVTSILGLLLVPIEIISFVVKPLSLAIRLFANMMAGHILLKVVYSFVLHFAHGLNIFTTLGFIANGFLIILTLLETAVAFIQALIFTILIAVYIQEMIHVG